MLPARLVILVVVFSLVYVHIGFLDEGRVLT